MRTCSKIGCDFIGQIDYTNKTIYCFKCNRFKQMRHCARQKNKYIPSWEELEIFLTNDMICPICNKQMVWHSKLGKLNNVISLQHNNNGTIILICYACNVGHGNSKLGDKYFDIPKNHKYCPKYKNILMMNKFSNDKRNKDNCGYICKQCKSKIYYRNKELGGK